MTKWLVFSELHGSSMTPVQQLFWMIWPAVVVCFYDAWKSATEAGMRHDTTFGEFLIGCWKILRNKPL